MNDNMNEIEKLLVLLISVGLIALAWCDPLFVIILLTIGVGYLISRRIS